MTKGDRIKQARIEKGITQDELGRLCETSKQNIYKYETGKITNIPSDMIEKLCAALGVSPSYLMGWGETEKESPAVIGEAVSESSVQWLMSLSQEEFHEVRDYIQYRRSRREDHDAHQG